MNSTQYCWTVSDSLTWLLVQVSIGFKGTKLWHLVVWRTHYNKNTSFILHQKSQILSWALSHIKLLKRNSKHKMYINLIIICRGWIPQTCNIVSEFLNIFYDFSSVVMTEKTMNFTCFMWISWQRAYIVWLKQLGYSCTINCVHLNFIL